MRVEDECIVRRVRVWRVRVEGKVLECGFGWRVRLEFVL